MLSALRRAVQAHLAGVPVQRRPALRRTEDPGALLMCDLPRIAGEEAVRAFTAALEAEGWQVRQVPGWLLLDHAVPVPQWRWPEEYPGEWGCCLQMLKRHPGQAAPEESIRALVKAQEQGRSHVERLCGEWHGRFAALLRQHQPLPGGLEPYLCAAMKEEEE